MRSRTRSTHLTDKLLFPLALLGAVQTVTGRVRTSFTTRHLLTTTSSTLSTTTARHQKEEEERMVVEWEEAAAAYSPRGRDWATGASSSPWTRLPDSPPPASASSCVWASRRLAHLQMEEEDGREELAGTGRAAGRRFCHQRTREELRGPLVFSHIFFTFSSSSSSLLLARFLQIGGSLRGNKKGVEGL